MWNVLLVEDNAALCEAMRHGLEATGEVVVTGSAARGEDALVRALEERPDVVLMDVQLRGEMNGIEAAISLRREYPRLPVVFYSIQDDDAYYRSFLHSGILSHYAYVRKSNYLLPKRILPLLRDAIAGRSFIDPEIEARVQEVRHKDANDPFVLLEPNERRVALLLAQGLTNGQIAERLGYRDSRAVSRTNGQIYTAWGLNETATEEKVARTRAAIIVRAGQLMVWDEEGTPLVKDGRGSWVPLERLERD
jgi:DNA-binding NarL/FixJ family response regulator